MLHELIRRKGDIKASEDEERKKERKKEILRIYWIYAAWVDIKALVCVYI